MEGTNMEIEKKLKEARANAGLTQEQVVEKIIVSRQTISNWERGISIVKDTTLNMMNLRLYKLQMQKQASIQCIG